MSQNPFLGIFFMNRQAAVRVPQTALTSCFHFACVLRICGTWVGFLLHIYDLHDKLWFAVTKLMEIA